MVFALGLILIAIEIFVIPGFGVTGIGGIILVIAGFILCLLDNIRFNFSGVGFTDAGRAIVIVLSGVLLGSLLTLWLSDRIGRKGVLRRVALEADLEDAVSAPPLDDLVGREGVASTVLRPSGKVIIDGISYDGVSESGFIEQGAAVRIIRYENAQVYVETT